ncbi:66286c2c-b128-48ae-bc35-6082e6641f81 [Thermothielavioides terrestris]|uniref:66286c2c-b128-48ae-bc35-6082e6641f81 n=1 Tax=Thermothielavioides terrestris TaxID=2587410 RepID=A0A446BDX1_9PEZI|nr:66286c2c-b128-48ae-bc35-6082e6641f81 [Thermothielavioides terrestris]
MSPSPPGRKEAV